MPVNESVIAALKLAANNARQPREVAQRLASWLDALEKGNVSGDGDEEEKLIADLLEQVDLPAALSPVDIRGLGEA